MDFYNSGDIPNYFRVFSQKQPKFIMPTDYDEIIKKLYTFLNMMNILE